MTPARLDLLAELLDEYTVEHAPLTRVRLVSDVRALVIGTASSERMATADEPIYGVPV